MADTQLKLSRRALLGAACAVPLRHPGLGSHQSTTLMGSLDPGPTFFSQPPQESWTPDQARGDEREWTRALASFRRAEAAVAALEGEPDEDAFGDALERFNEALAGLLAVPAPDVRALAVKLDLAIAADVQELSFGPPALAALARDAHRLS